MRRWRLLPGIALLAAGIAAGLAGCAAPEERPAVSIFDDENIEKQAIAEINARHTGKVHVNVTAFNRRLLLTGEVPTDASKEEIARIVSGVAKVRAVSNELVVGDISGLSSRTSDSMITSDVKYRLRGNGAFRAEDIKATTEAGTVFLLGNVHRRAGAAAAEVASTTKGVQSVVLVFDYLD